jgi:preprotein translocase subunit YajC
MNMPDLLLLAQAAAPTPEQPNLLVQMMPLIFIFVIFYVLLIRPQQKRQKEHEKLIAAVKTGDEVVTTSGIHGTVSNVKDKTLIIKIADNVKVEFDRAAVVTVKNAGQASAS